MWENQSLFLPAVFISGMVCMSVWWAEKAFADFADLSVWNFA